MTARLLFFTFCFSLLLLQPAWGQLSGTYVIDGSGSGDYTTFSAAAADLNSQGISGSVLFRVQPGTYREKIILDHVSGTSPQRTITFQSYTGNANDVLLRDTTGSTGDSNYVVRLHSTNHVRIENMTISSVGDPDDGRLIELVDTVKDVQVIGCRLLGNRSGAGIFFGLMAGGTFTTQLTEDVLVKDCYFHSTTYGILNQAGWFGGVSHGVVIEGNHFEDADAVSLSSLRDVVIRDNLLNGVHYTVEGIHLTSLSGKVEVTNNELYDCDGCLTFSNLAGQIHPDTPALFANNGISADGETFIFRDAKHTRVVFNTFNTYSESEGSIPSLLDSDSIIFKNNIVSRTDHDGPAMGFWGTDNVGVEMDYNNFWSGSGWLAWDMSSWLDTIRSIDTIQARYGSGNNTLSADPSFVNDTNLHIFSVHLNGAAQPLSYVTTDFEGDLRDLVSPDIGADETSVTANLVVDSLRISPQPVLTDTAMTIEYRITNQGNSAFTGPWRDEFYLSRDTLLGPNDIFLSDRQVFGTLQGGTGTWQTTSLNLQTDSTGLFYVLANMDADDALLEDNNDNVGVSEQVLVQFNNRPDLVVTAVIVPQQVNSGQAVQVNWTVKNVGNLPTVDPWEDWLYLSDDTSYLNSPQHFRPDSGRLVKIASVTGLAPGETYSSSYSFTLPLKMSGEFFVKVFTDAGDRIPEMAESTTLNAKVSTEMNVSQSPLADLAVYDLTVPPTSFAGNYISVSYRVENIGTAPTASDYWNDYIYVSTSPTFDHNDWEYRYEGYHWQELEADSSINVQRKVYLPDCIADTYYVYVVTDVFGKVLELAEENNGVRSDSIEVVLNPNPDFEVEDVTVQTSQPIADDSLHFSYFVANNGFDTSLIWILSEGFYLSPSATFDEEQAIRVGQHYEYDSLYMAPSERHTRDIALRIPDSIFGQQYLYVVADNGDEYCEAPYEGNNVTRIGPLNITRGPLLDLEVAQLNAPTAADAGHQVQISFIINNRGAAFPRTREWVDSLFLIPDGGTFKDRFKLMSEERQAQLASNETYSTQQLVMLPRELEEGDYRFLLFTDAGTDIYEHQSEANNIFESGTISVTRNPDDVPDLAVTSLTFASPSNSGTALEVTYTVENLSPTVSWTNNWKDHLALLDANGNVVKGMELTHFGELAENEDYTRTVDFILPEGIQGNYSMRVITDGKTLEYNTQNNRKVEPLEIDLAPWPDLQVPFVSTFDTLTAGQYTQVDWVVENFGQGAAEDTPWVDKVYLSKDLVVDESDIEMHSLMNTSTVLQNAQTYQQSEPFRVPAFASGAFYVLVQADARDVVYEHTDNENNTGYRPQQIWVKKPLPVDLHPVAASIQYTGDFLYTVKNIGTNAVKGSWEDAIFISRDRTWSEDDILAGYEEVSVSSLQPNDTYQERLDVWLPTVRPGWYYTIVKSDAFNYIPETDVANNVVASVDSFYLDFIADLPLNVAVDSVYDDRWGRDHYYELQVPADTGLLLTVDGHHNSTVMEAYYRTGELPERGGRFDYQGDDPFGNEQQILVPSKDSATTDYVLSWADSYWGENEFYTIKAQTMDFSVLDVTPEVGGDDGFVVIDIRGFDFSDSMEVYLQNATDTVMAHHVFPMSPTLVRAHVSLFRLPPAKYDVVVKRLDRGDTAMLTQGFEVQDTTFHQYYMNVTVPGKVRRGFDYTAQVDYHNRSNINDYDVVHAVVFYNENLNTEEFEVSYLGDGASSRLPDSLRWLHPYTDNVILKTPKAYVLLIWHPVYPSNAHGSYNFKLKSSTEDTVWTSAFHIPNPISPIHFTGHLDDLKYTYFIQQLDSVARAMQGRRSGDCISDPALVEAHIYKALRDQAEYLNGGIPGSPGDIAGTLLENTFRSFTDPSKAKTPEETLELTKMKSSIIENPTQQSPYDQVYRGVMNCMDVDKLEKKIRDECIQAVGTTTIDLYGGGQELRTTYEYVCDKNGNPPGGGGPGDKGGTNNINPDDPNEIVGPAGNGDAQFVAAGEKMPYTIYFENKPEATAPAQDVTIENPLPTEHDFRTFRLQEVGWGDTSIALPNTAAFNGTFDLGPDYDNLKLRLIAGINPSTGKAFWNFQTIDPATGRTPLDPLAGFLPPNDSTHIGEGYVSYTVEAKESLPGGTAIENQAVIVFDDELSLGTNVWTNVIAGSQIASEVNGLPAQTNQETFEVSWAKTSSDQYTPTVSGFDIYVAKDTNSFSLWLENTSVQKALYTGEFGHTYHFFSVARTEGGGMEMVPSGADAQTELVDTSTAIFPQPEAPQGLAFSLFPNPSTGELNIRFSIPDAGQVRVELLDLTGRNIALLDEGRYTHGDHTISTQANALNLNPGVYFVRLQAQGSTVIRKWVVTR